MLHFFPLQSVQSVESAVIATNQEGTLIFPRLSGVQVLGMAVGNRRHGRVLRPGRTSSMLPYIEKGGEARQDQNHHDD